MNIYRCDYCPKIFSDQRYLTRHVDSNVCRTIHECPKCGKEFSSAANKRQHLMRKIPCVPKEVPVININSNENKCMYCGKCFARPYTLKRHIDKCPMKNNQNALITLLLQKQEEDIHERQLLREAITNLGVKIPASTVTNNNTLNITNNTYVNVMICNFGEEDLSKLDATEIMELLKGQIENFIPDLIEYMHANPKYPERHNIFYDPDRNKALVHVPISDSEKSWRICEFQEALTSLTNRLKEHMLPLNSPYFDLASGAKDYDTANKIINISRHTDWMAPETVEKSKISLTKLTKNKEFMSRVEIDE